MTTPTEVIELLDRMEAARARLEEATPEQAIEILEELNDLAKDVQARIEQAHREADEDA